MQPADTYMLGGLTFQVEKGCGVAGDSIGGENFNRVDGKNLAKEKPEKTPWGPKGKATIGIRDGATTNQRYDVPREN